MAKTKKTKAKKQEQTKIPNTGRLDAIPEIEDADIAYRDARDARMEMQEQETEAQDNLTSVLREHGQKSYVYEGPDGKRYEAYLPAEVKAKSRRVKEPKAKKSE